MIILKQADEIEKIRASNKIVAEILQELKERVKPGVTTLELNSLSEMLARKRMAKPAFRGYRGYPFALCTSVNSEVVHGMPSERVLVDGDIVSLDFGIYHKGYYGDAAITVPVGEVSSVARRLIQVTLGGSALVSVLLAVVSAWPERVPDWAVLRWFDAGLLWVASLGTGAGAVNAAGFERPALAAVFLLLLLDQTIRTLGTPARASIVPLRALPSTGAVMAPGRRGSTCTLVSLVSVAVL